MSRHMHEQHSSSRRPGGLRSNIRTSIAAHRSRMSIAALTAGWAVLITDDAVDMFELPARIHDDLAGLLVAATVILALGWLYRGAALYGVLRLGRDIQTEAYRRAERRNAEEITLGIGIRN